MGEAGCSRAPAHIPAALCARQPPPLVRVMLPALRRGETVVRGQLPRWGWGKPRARLAVRTVVSRLGGCPLLSVPLRSPTRTELPLCGPHTPVVWLWPRQPHLFLFLFSSFPVGPSLSLRPGLPPALSPALCSKRRLGGRLQLWFWVGPSAALGFGGPGHISQGALGCSPWGAESGHCPDQQTSPPPTPVPPPSTWPVLGLGCPVALSAWYSVTAGMMARGGQAALCSWGRSLGGYKLGRHQIHFSGIRCCVLRQWAVAASRGQTLDFSTPLTLSVDVLRPCMCSGQVFQQVPAPARQAWASEDWWGRGALHLSQPHPADPSQALLGWSLSK